MKYYFSKILMLAAFVVATVSYFEKVFEVANYFMLGAILFQLISMEKKEEQPVEYLYTDSIMSHEEIDEINNRM